MAQDVKVRMPVGRGYGPFDFNRRDATRNAVTPPPTPPEPPESSVKTIQSIGEREKISGKGERDEPGWFRTQPFSDSRGGDGCSVGAAWDTEPVVTVTGCDFESVGVFNRAEHPGVSTATAKSKDAVVSHTKSDQSVVHQLSFALPPRMPKSQSQIVIVLNPCKVRLSWLLFTCFLQVK